MLVFALSLEHFKCENPKVFSYPTVLISMSCIKTVGVKVKAAAYSFAAENSCDLPKQMNINSDSLFWWVELPELNSEAFDFPQNKNSLLSSQGKTAATGFANQNIGNPANYTRMLLLKSIVEKVTGQKLKFFDTCDLESALLTISAETSTLSGATQRAVYGTDSDKPTSHIASNQTTMQASGIVKTHDGKEIHFNLNLVMQQQPVTICVDQATADHPAQWRVTYLKLYSCLCSRSRKRPIGLSLISTVPHHPKVTSADAFAKNKATQAINSAVKGSSTNVHESGKSRQRLMNA